MASETREAAVRVSAANEVPGPESGGSGGLVGPGTAGGSGPFGLGCAQLGNLYTAIDDECAEGTVAAAWDAGVRLFDTAPHYGLGLSERRLGAALRDRPRTQYLISTKVGRWLVPDPSGAARRDPEGFDVPADHRRVWDFTADGVRRSLDASLGRLGLDRIDLVLLHDPEEHQTAALDEAYPALRVLRDEGVVGAIGVGSKHIGVLERFVTEVDLDAVLIAGRYTLLEQSAAATLLPACQRRRVRVLLAGVFNSGLLAVESPTADLPYEYQAAPAEVVRRATAIADACRRHGTSLPAAALSFAATHPAVGQLIIGAAGADQVRRNVSLTTIERPSAAFWYELVDSGLLPSGLPLPSPG
ncbi:aldo/keto reductase [Solwaraspora sp. WMMD406]|uniref:aldo/keto reductase n=1 Tax=Solwaraspora sp. WMMD406 TaxID=3016095 RepID=UPI00241686C2|nr:aldo/keto reductase [Solwaraspora sp. WMMD406]MDG4766658.1 aldo/keto reductase [Solwaraspora sp. WMMD406]